MQKTILLVLLVFSLGKMGANAQTYSVIRSFGILTNISGLAPKGTLLKGHDGTLYGVAGPEGSVSTIYKIRADGTGFAVLKWFTNSAEGAKPSAGLVSDGETLYGTTAEGGIFGFGTVFKIKTDGSGFALLKSFANVEGANPSAALVLSDGVLYGTTPSDFRNNWGTVFKINTDGTGFGVLRSFSYTDGGNPVAGLAYSDGVLYGITSHGPEEVTGNIFRMKIDGTEFANLRSFPPVVYDQFARGTNKEGAYPSTGVMISGTTLYGATSFGGRWGSGGIFKVNVDGTGYTVLHDFTDQEGSEPKERLTLFEGTLYGATRWGGIAGVFGTVFKLNTDGSGFQMLKMFSVAEGTAPEGGLLISDGAIYGTMSQNGMPGGNGTLFKMNLNGTDYAILKGFGYSDSVFPDYLIAEGDSLYGTSFYGGTLGSGTIYKLKTDGSGYEILRNFGFSNGGRPHRLLSTGSELYGTAIAENGVGTVFKMNYDGTGYTVLTTLSVSNGNSALSSLAILGKTLYGTTYIGGNFGRGTLYKINTDGTGYAVLKNFGESDGGWPFANLTPSGDTLYGATTGGTIFKINTNGSGYVIIKQFSWPAEGGSLFAGLTLVGDTLYGAANQGGLYGSGNLFKLKTDGTGFTMLKDFPLTGDNPSSRQTNSEGAFPLSTLVIRNDTLYGSTTDGGPYGYGTLFSIKTNGSDFTVLKIFNGRDGGSTSGFAAVGSAIYGAGIGGDLSEGVVFKMEFAPVITRQPQSGISPCGSAVTLTVLASGSQDIEYQWYRGTDLIFGATNSSLPFTASVGTAGSYAVIVANSYGAVTSTIANIVVIDNEPPIILSSPTNEILEANASCRATLPDLSCRLVASNCTGSIIVSQIPPPETLLAPGITSVSITATDASEHSTNVLVSVTVLDVTPPVIRQCPSSRTVAVGSNCLGVVPDLINEVVATDNCDGPIVVTQNPPAGTLVPLGPTNVQFQIMDASTNVATCSSLVTIQDLSLPMILKQPESRTNVINSDAIFEVTAMACSPIRYQWLFNGTNLINETNASLRIDSVQLAARGPYAVVVSNDARAVTSSIAFLQVDTPPVADASATRTLVLSGNGTNGTIVLDATHSSDVDGDILDYQWSILGDAALVTNGVVAVIVLPIGSHRITLHVSDGLATATDTIVVEVITSAHAVENLITVINSDVLHVSPLVSSLRAATASIDRSNPVSAINQLQVFQNKLRVQLAPLDAVLAESLIQSAQEVINTLTNSLDNSTSHGPVGVKIGKLLPQSNGRVKIQFGGRPGKIYVIAASTNLIHWEFVGVATNYSGDSYQFEEIQNIGFGKRFYRIVSP